MGKHEKAVVLLEQMVPIETKRLAKTHPDRLYSQLELAIMYEAKGQVTEQRPLSYSSK
jgi:hypothetical protein